MRSKELVKRTLEFDLPDRIPRQLWLLPWQTENNPKEVAEIQEKFPDDIIAVGAFYKETPKTRGDAYKIGTYIDEWGCEFINIQSGVIGEVKNPMINTWDDLSMVKTPNEMLTVDKDTVNEFCSKTDKFLLGGCYPRPFERLQFLRGTENVMMDIALQQDECLQLIKIIHEHHIKEFEVWAETDVDGLMFMDDWGSQDSLLISPVMWRKIFKPLYKDYIDIAHNSGKKAFMHSDGYIMEIYEDLIELGLDALNSQIFCMGVEELGEKFKGRITFWGEIDRQHLLHQGTFDEIETAVKLVHKSLYQNGGVIAQLSFGVGEKPENVRKALETWEAVQVQN